MYWYSSRHGQKVKATMLLRLIICNHDSVGDHLVLYQIVCYHDLAICDHNSVPDHWLPYDPVSDHLLPLSCA